ncbi:MAG: glycosyltransferase family 2 protein [Pseudomonadota bacterium]
MTVQVLIPMAGSGRPFETLGQSFPKPLVEIHGKPLVEYAVEGVRLSEPQRYIFVTGEAEVARFELGSVLHLIAPDSRMFIAKNSTGGALCSALLAVDLLDPEQPLMVCNGDQYLRKGVTERAINEFRERDLDVGILTFDAIHPRWSFARIDEETGLVVETAEKRPISRHATVGVYYYRNAEMFIRSGVNAILKNNCYNEQFYICPSINELILEGCRVGAHAVGHDEFFALGTPEDVQRFKSHAESAFFLKGS